MHQGGTRYIQASSSTRGDGLTAIPGKERPMRRWDGYKGWMGRPLGSIANSRGSTRRCTVESGPTCLVPICNQVPVCFSLRCFLFPSPFPQYKTEYTCSALVSGVVRPLNLILGLLHTSSSASRAATRPASPPFLFARPLARASKSRFSRSGSGIASPARRESFCCCCLLLLIAVAATVAVAPAFTVATAGGPAVLCCAAL